MTNDQEDLKRRIQSELIATGAYTQIYNSLKIQLVNSGWVEKFNQLTRDTINSIENDEDLKFINLINKLESKGLNMVDDNVKIEILRMIKDFLNDVVK